MEQYQADMDEPGEVSTARLQRDQAVACAILSLCITIAVILSNFGSDPTPYQQARYAVEQHKAILAENEVVLRANEAVLVENQTALESLRKAANNKQP